MWVVKRATSLLNSFCSNVAKQVACFLLPVFPYLKKLLYLFKVVLSTSKHLQASFQGSKRTDVPHTNCTTQKKLINYKTIILYFEEIEKREMIKAVKPGPSQLILADVFLKKASTTIE